MATATAATATGAATRHRPFDITLLVVLGYVSGVFMMLLGAGLFLLREDSRAVRDVGLDSDALAVFALVLFGIGLVKVILTHMLGRGSEVVRVLFAVVSALSLAGGLWNLVVMRHAQAATGAGSVIFSLLVLYLLLNHRSSDWFENHA